MSHSFGKTPSGWGTIAFLALAISLTASTLYTDTYSGPAFTILNNNSVDVAPILSGNIDISLTLDVPVLSNVLLTDYTSDITAFAVSDGQQLLDPAGAAFTFGAQLEPIWSLGS